MADRGLERFAATRARLLAPVPSLGVPAPAYAGRSLPNVATSAVRALGAEPSTTALPGLEAAVDPFAGRRAEGPVVLFTVDGLGFDRLAAAATGPDGRWARRWLGRSEPITTVFPTTTTVALASLSTASSPSRHGLVGYRQFLPQFGSVVDMLRQSPLGVAGDEALVGPTWSPSVVLGAAPVYAGRVPGTVALSRDRFEGSGFTRLLYDGAEYVPYAGYADFAAGFVHLLRRSPPPPLVFAYWDELDTVEHLQGPSAPAVDLELERLGELLAFVARSVGPALAARTTVLVSADHGLVPLDPDRQTAVDQVPEVMRHLARPPTGDRRVGLFRARTGEVDALAEELRRRLLPGTRILPAEEAIRGGLFGPPPYHPELTERVGDLVVLVPSPGGITYTVPGKYVRRRVLHGGHGGLEPAELLVPLVAGTLAELGAPIEP